MKNRKSLNVVVSRGQYEQSACVVKITYTTKNGLIRRLKALRKEYAVYGDNWAGWINASIAIADKADTYGDNSVIGGQWCDPVNGWLAFTDYDNLCVQLRHAGIQL